MDITPTERIELAQALGMNEQFLYQCLTGRRAMDPAQAVIVERVSGGRVTRRMLRRDDWHKVWPELVTKQHPAPKSAAKA